MLSPEVHASPTPRPPAPENRHNHHVSAFRTPANGAVPPASEMPALVADSAACINELDRISQEHGLPDTPSLSQTQTQRDEDFTRPSQNGWGALMYKDRSNDTGFITIPVESEMFIVGRGIDADFDIKRNECSKTHFILRNSLNNDGMFVGPCTIEDRSTNGTWINQVKMAKNVIQPLRHGDSIFVRSSHEFIFRHRNGKNIEDELFACDQEFGTVSKDYEFHDKIGSGSYATVYRVKNRDTRELHACKVVNRTKARLGRSKLSGDQAETKIPEVQALRKGCSHRNIIRYHNARYTQNNIYIFLELVRGGELFEYLRNRGRIPEREAMYIVYQILEALSYLHSKRIAHRDVKPENILMDEPKSYTRVVLSDFGLAKQIQTRVPLKTLCGTLHYIAPEILLVGTNDGEPAYNSAVDIYALGVMTFFLVSGFLPFEGKTDADLRRSILKGKPNYREANFDWKTLSPNCLAFIKKLMSHSEHERPTAKECYELPWLKDHADWLLGVYLGKIDPHKH